MKALIIILATVFSTQVFAEKVTCFADKGIQQEMELKADAELTFDLDRNTETLTNLIGHIFVQAPYGDANEEINIDNSYMGFFQTAKLAANKSYRPIVYKGWTQFKNLDAVHTAGNENGMWGILVVNLAAEDKFEARYIFQAGDHMGGTVLLNCRTH